jgi:hypothetical protein
MRCIRPCAARHLELGDMVRCGSGLGNFAFSYGRMERIPGPQVRGTWGTHINAARTEENEAR